MEIIIGKEIPQSVSRLKLFHIGQNELITILNTNVGDSENRTIIEVLNRPDEIPPDAKVWAVYNNWVKSCITVVVEHPSYEESPLGREIPGDKLVVMRRTAYRVFKNWIIDLDSMDRNTMTILRDMINDKLSVS